MPWFVQQSTGKLEKAAASPGAGWLLVPGSTDAMTAQQAANELTQQVASGAFGTSILGGITKAAGDVASAAASATGLSGLDAIAGTLTTKNLWIRVAKVIIGGALVLIGLAHITGADNAVATAARKAPLPV